jgi:hypothetical protein
MLSRSMPYLPLEISWTEDPEMQKEMGGNHAITRGVRFKGPSCTTEPPSKIEAPLATTAMSWTLVQSCQMG